MTYTKNISNIINIFIVINFIKSSIARKAIILYLAQISSKESNQELEFSLKALDLIFLSTAFSSKEKQQRYPVYILYDSEEAVYLTSSLYKRFVKAIKLNLNNRMSETDAQYLCNAVNASAFANSKVDMCFIPILNFRNVPWPFHLYKNDYKEESLYYSRLGYRNMCRFWIKSLFEQRFMHDVTHYFRLDTDSFLEKMPQNPFHLLQYQGLAYLSSMIYLENESQTKGLWETFLQFALENNIHPVGLEPLSKNNELHQGMNLNLLSVQEAVDILLKRGYNLRYFYNNWEVTRVDIWKTDIYKKLSDFIDRAGGIFMRRWGDAPVRTLALHLLRNFFANVTNESPAVFRQYPGLVYFHKARHATQPW